jgi:hypothetical protein
VIMPRSVKLTRLFAVIALLAWSNVQAMVCCFAMPSHASADKVEVAAPIAEDHSCCPGGESQTTTEKPASPESSDKDCGMTRHGASALCCTHSDPAEEVASFSPQFSFVQLALIAYLLPALPEKPPEAVPPSRPLASSGPPRYLALERILI